VEPTRESTWPIARTATRPLLEHLRSSRTSHWYAFAIVFGASLVALVAAAVLLQCEDEVTEPCSPGKDAVDTSLSLIGLVGLAVATPVTLALAIRSHVQFQRALAKDVDSPFR
jgi:hypothetical protein